MVVVSAVRTASEWGQLGSQSPRSHRRALSSCLKCSKAEPSFLLEEDGAPLLLWAQKSSSIKRMLGEVCTLLNRI